MRTRSRIRQVVAKAVGILGAAAASEADDAASIQEEEIAADEDATGGAEAHAADEDEAWGGEHSEDHADQ